MALPHPPGRESPRQDDRCLCGRGVISRGLPSLPEVYRSVPIFGSFVLAQNVGVCRPRLSGRRRLHGPGNWATDLGGGSKFGYTLLSVVLLSSLLAIFLQALSAKLGIATGRDLAQACREQYSAARAHCSCGCCAKWPSPPATWPKCWARPSRCKLLFGLPLLVGVLLTGARRADRAGLAGPRIPLDRSAGDRADRHDRRLFRLRNFLRAAAVARSGRRT